MELRDRRAEDGPAPLEIGQRVELGPYAVTLTGTETHAGFPDDPASAQGRVLWVRARVENLTSSTRADLGDYLRPGGAEAAPDGPAGESALFLARDGERRVQLQPALVEDVVLAAPAPPGDTARVTLFSATWKARDALAGFGGWYDLEPKASTLLPVPKQVQP